MEHSRNRRNANRATQTVVRSKLCVWSICYRLFIFFSNSSSAAFFGKVPIFWGVAIWDFKRVWDSRGVCTLMTNLCSILTDFFFFFSFGVSVFKKGGTAQAKSEDKQKGGAYSMCSFLSSLWSFLYEGCRFWDSPSSFLRWEMYDSWFGLIKKEKKVSFLFYFCFIRVPSFVVAPQFHLVIAKGWGARLCGSCVAVDYFELFFFWSIISTQILGERKQPRPRWRTLVEIEIGLTFFSLQHLNFLFSLHP